MTDDLSGYFGLAAQVIPVLLLALVIESGFLPQLRAEVAAIRTVQSLSLEASPTSNTVDNPTTRPMTEVVIEVLVDAVRTGTGLAGDLAGNLAFRVVSYVQETPKVRSFIAVAAIDVTLIGAVVCEAIALVCVAFDLPRTWEVILGFVVLAGLIALLGLTLFALR